MSKQAEIKPHLLIIGGKDHTYQRAIELECRFSAIQLATLVTGYQTNNAAHLIVTDYTNIEVSVAFAKALHKEDPFDAVFSFSEYSQAAAAHIAEELALPSNCKVQSINCTRDKESMRALLRDSGLPIVQSELVTDVHSLTAFAECVGYPVIVKPRSGAGSEGIYFVANDSCAGPALRHCQSVSEFVLAEKFIGGQEYSVESLSVNGAHNIVMITEKYTSEAPYFVEKAHTQPAKMDDSSNYAISRAVQKLLELCGHQCGPAHTEIKLYNDAVYIIETQLRFGGDQIWEMTQQVSGIDLVKETFSALVRTPKPSRQPYYASMAISFLFKQLEQSELKHLLEKHGLTEYVVRYHFNNGEDVISISHSGQRAGYVLFGFQTDIVPRNWQSFNLEIGH